MGKLSVREKFAISIVEAADYFSLGEKKVRELVKDYPDVGYYEGNRYRVIREEMENLLRRHFEERKPDRPTVFGMRGLCPSS